LNIVFFRLVLFLKKKMVFLTILDLFYFLIANIWDLTKHLPFSFLFLPQFLYMLFPYISGGELFSYLRSSGRFSTSTSQFYSSEIVLAIEYLHSLSIVYRDLKPENLLLDRDGHLRITDFGNSFFFFSFK